MTQLLDYRGDKIKTPALKDLFQRAANLLGVFSLRFLRTQSKLGPHISLGIQWELQVLFFVFWVVD